MASKIDKSNNNRVSTFLIKAANYVRIAHTITSTLVDILDKLQESNIKPNDRKQGFDDGHSKEPDNEGVFSTDGADVRGGVDV